MLRVAPEDEARQEFALALDEICRRGAERMLAVALEAEVQTYLERHREARDNRGHALVVRNGSARERTVGTVALTEVTSCRPRGRGCPVRSPGRVRRTRRQVERPAVRRSRDRRNPCGGSG